MLFRERGEDKVGLRDGQEGQCVWEPSLLPQIPPDPTAIKDWITWYPEPCRSASGFMKLVKRSR